MKHERDRELGDALLQVPVPPAEPGFIERVLQRLDDHREAERKRRKLRLRIGAEVAVATLAVGWLMAGGPLPFGSKVADTRTASAAERMVDRMSWATSSTTSIRADFVFLSTRRSGTRLEKGHFTATLGGDFRVDMTVIEDTQEGGEDHPAGTKYTSAYDAAHHRLATAIVKPGGLMQGGVTSGVWPAAGRTFWGASPFEYQGYAQLLKTAIREADPSVRVYEVTHEGRAAWRALLKTGDYACEITVDQGTGFIVRFSARQGEGSIEVAECDTLNLTNVERNAPIASDTFRPKHPEGEESKVRDGGWQFGSVALLARRTALNPVVPAMLPGGFALANSATTYLPFGVVDLLAPHRGTAGVADGRNNVIAVEYRRGLGSLQVLTAGTGFPAVNDEERVRRALVGRMGFREVRIGEGAFAGCRALTWFDAQGANLLVGERVLIQGDVTRPELLALANSLQVQSP